MTSSDLRFGVLTATLIVSAWSSITHAQTPSEVAARRGLLDQAQQSSEHGDHTAALDLAQRAGSISMSPSLRLFIAGERAALGQYAPALGDAIQCRVDAEHQPTLPNRDAVMSQCRALESSLRSHVGTVVILLPAHTSPIVVRVNGDIVSDALLGVPYPVTPGTISIDITADNASPVHRDAAVTAGTSINVDLPLPVVTTTGRTEPSSGSTGSRNEQRTASNSSSSGPVTTTTSHPIRIAPIALAGVGVVALGASLVFFILRGSALGSCTVYSDHIGCPDAMSAQRAQNAPPFTIVSDVALGVGILAVAGGVAWWFLGAPSHHEGSALRRIHFDMAATPGGAMATLGGAL